MRFKFGKLVTFFIVIINILALYYTWRLFSRLGENKTFFNLNYNQVKTEHVTRSPNKHISKLVTVVIRQFELYENDVTGTVESFASVFPNMQILVVCDDIPYPPLLISNVTSRNVRIVNLSLSLTTPLKDRIPVFMIKTKYVLYVPDSTRIPSRQILQSMIVELNKNPNDLVAVLYPGENKCLNINLSVREWSIKYDKVKGGTVCDAITGKHAILLETQLLKQLPDPFLLPFPEVFYIQTAAIRAKTHIIPNVVMWDGRPVLHSHHSQWRKQQIEAARRKTAYAQLSLKKVTRETGSVEWYGCTRDGARCFGTVYDSVPSYLYKDRWTPPCCLAHLRKTARHVLTCLADAGVRHWLEAGSLLGAMRTGDILPWDYDVDIGINRDDVRLLARLSRASGKPVTDEQGFVWEKATEGQFYRVHFSKTNRIHVNLFPFYTKNGTMTKDGWFTGHRNMEFPDYFLHPMSTIEFIGKQVPSPNNIRDFLEMKYGEGAIENPQYPDPSKIKFPKDIK